MGRKVKKMTAAEFCRIQELMGLDAIAMGELLNTSPRNVEGWRTGRKGITGTTAKLVKVIFRLSSDLEVSSKLYDKITNW